MPLSRLSFLLLFSSTPPPPPTWIEQNKVWISPPRIQQDRHLLLDLRSDDRRAVLPFSFFFRCQLAAFAGPTFRSGDGHLRLFPNRTTFLFPNNRFKMLCFQRKGGFFRFSEFPLAAALHQWNLRGHLLSLGQARLPNTLLDLSIGIFAVV